MPASTRRSSAGPRHPIAVVAARTGLSPDVLRAWERRYGVVRPARAPDGQRLYSDADVERLRWLRLATEAGRAIGQVAKLPSPALAKLVEEDVAARPAGPRDEPRVDDVAAAALARARAFDGAGLEALLRRSAGILGIDAFLQDVCAAVLRRIGDEWHAGQLSPAQEHLASVVVQQVVIASMRELARLDGPRVVVATPPGERHAIGAATVGAFAAAEGWDVVYLGTDLPVDDIARSALETEARLVVLSLVYVENRRRLFAQLRRLRDALPPGIRIVAGGSGAAALGPELKRAGIRVRETLSDLRVELRAAS